MFLFWLLLLPITDLRDWIASDRWQTTGSASRVIQPKSSQVRYTYVVNGREYSGDRSHFFVTSLYQDQRHLNWLNANREAESVTVYYDPDVPQRAVRWAVTGVISVVTCLTPMLFFGVVWWWLRHQFPRYALGWQQDGKLGRRFYWASNVTRCQAQLCGPAPLQITNARVACMIHDGPRAWARLSDRPNFPTPQPCP